MNDQPGRVSEHWRNRAPLTGTDLVDFLALRRVCGRADSRVHQVGKYYVDSGRPVLPFIADGLTALIEIGHATVGEPGPEPDDRRPLLVTATGRARYEQLCDAQGIPPYSGPGGTAAETTGP